MTARVYERVRSFPNNIDIGPYLRVKNNAGVLALAGAAEDELGILEQRVFASESVAPVRLLASDVTVRMIANGAITQYADVYRAASGKISATAGGERIGIALEAATGDGSIIEVLPNRKTSDDVSSVTGGLRVARGQQATVAASDTVVTGLTTVVAVVATLDSDPVDNPEWVTASIGDQAGAPAAGSILIKTWQNTAGNDPTPSAATVFGKKVNWVAFGT